ncbi:MAG TPA: heavy metal translocating P-type ATPase metal-binding domain-containing protein, partial [Candidatus Kapabacteria bacterium]|nr:heavy metal translocating P-type ATPase metal-binding domain-containing protein [Candidatus Kapabacteria bacterium]
MKQTSSIEQLHCAHCGEHCDNEIMLDDKAFCCDGCKTVYSILHDNGLCDYYRYDDHSLTSLKNMSYRKERFAYLDEQEIQDRLLDFQSPSLYRTRFILPQIHCASCLWLLEKLNRINNGIIRSTVDFTRKELSVEFDPSITSLRSIVELLTAIGYEPTITVNTNVKPVNNAKKSLYLKIGLAGFATGNIMLFSMPDYLDTTDVLTTEYGIIFSVLNIALATPVLLYSASDYFKNAYRAFTTRSMSLDVPLALGILTLYVRSIFDILMNHSPGFMDSFSGLVFLLLIGKLVQQRTIDAFSFERNYASYLPLSVQVVDDGSEKSQSVTSLRVGDIIRIRNKEIVPTDSVLLSRLGHVDYSFVTGEAAPVELVQGAKVYAGGRIVGNSVELTVQKEVSRSYLT